MMHINRESLQIKIDYEKSAEKFFRKHEDIRQEYVSLLWELYCGEHPERVDIKTIKGKKGLYYRMKLGNWRVIYTELKDRILVINTLHAGSRGDIYKKLGGLKSLL